MSTLIATTPSMSERLLYLGLKPETSDMHWCDGALHVGRILNTKDPIACPAWSLAKIEEILPPALVINGKPHKLVKVKYTDVPCGEITEETYYSHRYVEVGNEDNFFWTKETDPLRSAYECLCFAIDQVRCYLTRKPNVSLKISLIMVLNEIAENGGI